VVDLVFWVLHPVCEVADDVLDVVGVDQPEVVEPGLHRFRVAVL